MISRSTIQAFGSPIDSVALAGRFVAFAGKHVLSIRILGAALLVLGGAYAYRSYQKEHSVALGEANQMFAACLPGLKGELTQQLEGLSFEGFFSGSNIEGFEDSDCVTAKEAQVLQDEGRFVKMALTFEVRDQGGKLKGRITCLREPKTESAEGKISYTYAEAQESADQEAQYGQPVERALKGQIKLKLEGPLIKNGIFDIFHSKCRKLEENFHKQYNTKMDRS